MGLKCRHRGAQYGHMGQGGSTPQCGIPAQSPQGPSNGGSDCRIAQTAVGRGFSALEAISLKTHRVAQRELGFRDSGGRGIAQPQPLTHPRRTSSPFRKKTRSWDSGLEGGGERSVSAKGPDRSGPGSTGFRSRETGDNPFVVSETQARSRSRAACPWEDTPGHSVGENSARAPLHPELRTRTLSGIYIAQLEL